MRVQAAKSFKDEYWGFNAPWIALVVAYWAFAALHHAVLGEPFSFVLAVSGLVAGASSTMLWLCVVALVALVRRRDASPLQRISAEVKAALFAQRTASVFTVATLVFLFQTAFVSVKRTIPQIQPFYLDPWLARADEMIHGVHPWRLVEPIVGNPLVAGFVDLAYTAWLPIMMAAPVLVAGWLERPKLRAQFLLSFFLCWILLGNVLAMMMSSVGPCFYDHFYPGSGLFADKMALLKAMGEQIPLTALKLQDIAISSVTSDDHGDWYAISAMPSLHVAIATLLLIMGFKVNRTVGVSGAVFFGTIMLGSVYLAWHYAVDGYVSIIAVGFIWKLSGWLVSQTNMIRVQAPESAPA